MWFVSWMPIMRQDLGRPLYISSLRVLSQVPPVSPSGPCAQVPCQVEVVSAHCTLPAVWAPAGGRRCLYHYLGSKRDTQNNDGRVTPEINEIGASPGPSKRHFFFFFWYYLWHQGQNCRPKRSFYSSAACVRCQPSHSLACFLNNFKRNKCIVWFYSYCTLLN